MEKKSKMKWYDNASTITTLLIGIILIIIVCSQSFVAPTNFSIELFESILNHNSVYLLVLIYFCFIKFPVGKKYFNYFNVFLIFIYFLAMITSFLTVIQSFSLNTILSFIENFLFVLYMVHTLFRDTRLWKEFNIHRSPFNELSNDWYYYSIVVVSCGLLAVNLISTVVIRGVIISILDCFYILLLGRYIYLYHDYLDEKELDSNNEGNFDDIREKVHENVQEVLDKTEIDDKIMDASNTIEEKVNDFIDEKGIDKVINNTTDKIIGASNTVEDKVNDFIDEKGIDEVINHTTDQIIHNTPKEKKGAPKKEKRKNFKHEKGEK